MKKLLLAFGMFAATYLLLSIDLDGKTLFERLYRVTSPLTVSLQRSIEGMMGRSYDGTREVGRKLFNNSLPESSRPAQAIVPRKLKAPEESLSEAERSELNSLIKTYSR
jgi:hypothetical protein